MRAAPQPLKDKLEKTWDAELFVGEKALARRLGWTSYHTLRSKGSKSGFPDRTLFRERVVFAELKRELGVPTDLQVEYLDGLARAGAEVYLWKPHDLEEVAEVLRRRWVFAPYRSGQGMHEAARAPELLMPDVAPWTPRSVWVPGVGRAEEMTEFHGHLGVRS